MTFNIRKALMIDPKMMEDPFILNKVYGMIKKRIQMAAKGSIQLSNNYAIVSGDLHSLAQSIFGLPVSGLLKPGEVYHRYWRQKVVKPAYLVLCTVTYLNRWRIDCFSTVQFYHKPVRSYGGFI